jgi:hypothetical protein
MANVPIKLPPGLFQNGTQYAIKDRWFDGNMIRWVNNEMQPIGGWTLFGSITATEPIRAIYSYIDNAGTPWNIFGAADKLYAASDAIPLVFYDITPTTLAYNPGGQIGYGSKAYGTGVYGSRRPTSVEISAGALWNFDNYGERLMASHSQDGRVFEWNPNTPATPALEFSGPNAPTSVADIVVTNERHLMAFATGDDPRSVQWADRDDPSDWDYTSTTNTAGRFTLQSKGVIITALRVFNGILVITDEDAHLIYFVGGDAIYASQVVGSDNCGAISNKSPVAIPDGAVWPGQASFWFYNGSVQRLPCDLLENFYSGSLTQSEDIHGGYNEKFNEVWWFRPSAGFTEPNEAFIWSKRDRAYWTKADLTRYAVHHISLQDEPFMTKGQDIFLHEVGYTDNGGHATAFC